MLHLRITITALITLLLSACLSEAPAPVVEGWLQPNAKSAAYRVHEGDTLYSIAWAYRLDYRALAKANQLSPPYRIKPGQRLNMVLTTPVTKSSKKISPPIIVQNSVTSDREQAYNPPAAQVVSRETVELTAPVRYWSRPAQGHIINNFSAALGGNNGIDIVGQYGEPIRAAANGVVVYSGAGIRGYGKLIIVKHNNSYLSAYAFNKRILVKEGSRVRAGQIIAEMGRNDAGRTMLHFEIRRDGLPINPLRYLS